MAASNFTNLFQQQILLCKERSYFKQLPHAKILFNAKVRDEQAQNLQLNQALKDLDPTNEEINLTLYL